MDPGIELIQFPYSHYNEKARWALDWKRVPHRRRSLLPGPHGPVVLRLTGSTQVPVLRMDGETIPGSARILEVLEERFPDPPLVPRDPAQRARALEVQRRFDEEVGPPVRRALFSLLVEEPGYTSAMFAGHRGPVVRAVYRVAFPLIAVAMKRSMGITGAAAVQQAFAATERALEFVAKEAGPEGYLVGGAFSLADLTCAALLAPAANPPDSPMARPEPMPPRLVEGWQMRWAGHPGTAWVHEIYRRHRGCRRCDGGRQAEVTP